MLTKKDISLLLEHLVTKTEFNQAIEKIQENLVTKNDLHKVMVTVEKVLVEVIATRLKGFS